jgi:hypothetical protein
MEVIIRMMLVAIAMLLSIVRLTDTDVDYF